MSFIHLQDVGRSYGSHQALKNVTLDLAPGRIGLLGPNGAGKSTLLKILLGLLPPSTGSGSVLGHALVEETANGKDYSALGKWWRTASESFSAGEMALRRTMGYMPEADALVPGLTGAEYVALAGEMCGMPRKQAQRRAHELLTCLLMEDARYRRLEEYSTGMKQRIKLAQAVVHDPPLLLLDEPTSGLDPAGRDAMLRLLLSLGKDHGKSIILCTHLLQDVERVCETVVILRQGQVLLHGSIAALRASTRDRYRLELLGDVQRFKDELCQEGATVLDDNGQGKLRVAVPNGWITRAFFSLADNHGVTVRGLQRDEEDLEELFHRVLAERGP
jgi:ABC-2 type transport system ATP-binding protein